ncbi:polysaccharide deacetylase family protein [Carnobacterium gallinarum]|uniref:polysaccharide deacetylase family protein n=1 Tax=Carnobacterium gallinarum TaxID=2749 RepID=UPI00055819DE|nr:polysaccharide deacetylase family protein [Carnobacterium gallinarum]
MKKYRMLLGVITIFMLVFISSEMAYGVNNKSEQGLSHTVEKGETLWRIAKKYQIPMEEIKELNQMNTDTVYAGQQLKVAATENNLPNTSGIDESATETTTYMVQSGETLWRIATRYKMTVNELKKLNQLDSDTIVAGKTLLVKKAVEIDMMVKKDKVIALTFDDGPNRMVTPRILDILKQNDVKATFFVLGNSVQLNPDILEREIKDGHEIGNHTFSHPVLTDISLEEAKQQVVSTNELIRSIADYQVKLLRPPYGTIDDKLMAVYQMPIIEWSVDTEDWKSRNADAVYNEVLQNSKSGAIVLMHDIHPTTADALNSIIQSLKKQGYQFVTVSELYNGVLSGNKSYYQANDIR